MLLRCLLGARLSPILSSRRSLCFTKTFKIYAMGHYTGPVGTIPNDAKTGERGEPMTPIPSASLIVLCPISGHQRTKHGILMQQRSARDGSSFQMAVVFPGGALDLADLEAVKNAGTNISKEEEYDHALRLCALREAFEETGLLLLPTADSATMKSRAIGPAEAKIEPAEWAKIREEVHNDARAFPSFLSRVTRAIQPNAKSNDESALPALAPIRHHSIWITPRAVVRPAKRFDAHFYITILDKVDALGPLTSTKTKTKTEAGALSLSADGSETTSLRLATAEEMIDLAIRDEIVLFPPQFYILADLAASLRKNTSEQADIPPLIFKHPGEPPPQNAKGVTPVEEEARGTQDDQYPQFSKSPKSIKAAGTQQSITSVEPRAVPTSGANVSNLNFAREGQREKQSAEMAGDEEEEDVPFVFPLVLPGDFLASQDQQAKMGGSKARSNEKESAKPINRLYVTPRSRKDGGGLIVRGARRRGLPGLIDFEEGARLEEMGAGDKIAQEEDMNLSSKPFQTKL